MDSGRMPLWVLRVITILVTNIVETELKFFSIRYKGGQQINCVGCEFTCVT